MRPGQQVGRDLIVADIRQKKIQLSLSIGIVVSNTVSQLLTVLQIQFFRIIVKKQISV